MFSDHKIEFSFNNMKVHRLQSLALTFLMICVMADFKESAISSTKRSSDEDLVCSDLNRDYPPAFVLYKSENGRSWNATVANNKEFVKHLDLKKKIVFIIHGFLNGCDQTFVKTTKAAYLKWRPDVQVVTVCWAEAFPALEKEIGYLSWLSFPLSEAAVPCVGEAIAEFLENLHEDHGVPWKNMTIVSHSLGSQVAGAAGGQLNGKIKKLIALDPARPLWQITEGYLNSKSANQVIALHTSFLMGIRDDTGTVDFYANSGLFQPGCYVPMCDHYRSVDLFIESLKNKKAFEGTKCETYLEYAIGFCDGHEKAYFTSNTKATGTYFFKTGSNPPYSKL